MKLLCRKNGSDVANFTDGKIYETVGREGDGVFVRDDLGYLRLVLPGQLSAHLVVSVKDARNPSHTQDVVGVFEIVPEGGETMTAKEALQILRNVWGSGGVIGAHDVARLEAVALPSETLLQTAARIAGVDVSDVAPFACATVSNRCAEREIALN